MSSIGERVKNRRISLGMSQTELAELLGFKDKSSICRIEKDERKLPQSMIVKLANVLNTTPAYIMGWEEENKSNIEKWEEATKGMDFSKEELEKIIDYAKYLISSRDK